MDDRDNRSHVVTGTRSTGDVVPKNNDWTNVEINMTKTSLPYNNHPVSSHPPHNPAPHQARNLPNVGRDFRFSAFQGNYWGPISRQMLRWVQAVDSRDSGNHQNETGRHQARGWSFTCDARVQVVDGGGEGLKIYEEPFKK
jgi:hypothetical protein